MKCCIMNGWPLSLRMLKIQKYTKPQKPHKNERFVERFFFVCVVFISKHALNVYFYLKDESFTYLSRLKQMFSANLIHLANTKMPK